MNLATNSLQNQPEDEERHTTQYLQHVDAPRTRFAEYGLSPGPESGSSGVSRHALDGIFGDATSGWVQGF